MENNAAATGTKAAIAKVVKVMGKAEASFEEAVGAVEAKESLAKCGIYICTSVR